MIQMNTCFSVHRRIGPSLGAVSTARTGRSATLVPASHATGHSRSSIVTLQCGDVRRLDIMWSGDEASDYDSIKDEAETSDTELPEFVKNIIRSHLEGREGE